jgi:nickel-dependent lactate racemase
MKDAECLDDIFRRIEQRFVMGGHKAYGIAKILKRVEVILVSCLQKKDAEKMFFTYARDLKEAMAMVRKKHGENFKAYIIPEGGYIIPTRAA